MKYEIRRPGGTAWAQDIPTLGEARREQRKARQVTGQHWPIVEIDDDGKRRWLEK
jgi:hypothetical protein